VKKRLDTSIASSVAVHSDAEPKAFDLLRVPILGKFFQQRHARTLLQLPMLIVAVAMVLHGLFGPALAPKNLATTLSWVHFRGALVLTLLLAGNFFCLACPLMLPRELARRFFKPRLNWPRMLRNKWLSIGLFVLILFIYELFDLWGSPWWTAWLILAYFMGAVTVDGLFKHASFCKFVCPIGQFNFVASTVSPLEIKVRRFDVCDECKTKDCIRGRRTESLPVQITQRGCELALFQPMKSGNMDCTFCLDCVHACPHDNVGIIARTPATELMSDPPRSGVGRYSRRRDLSALVIIFTFGALLNAFGMVSPVYALQSWMAQVIHLNREAAVLGILFGFLLIVEPVVLLGLAGLLTRKWGESRLALLPLIVKYSYTLVPLGFGVWLSHYSFHFFTGLLTFIPVTQNALVELGLPILGSPQWELGGIPAHVTYPIELGFLTLGLLGSLLVTYRLSIEDSDAIAKRVFVIWAGLFVLLSISAFWLMSQPMEMRGGLLGG
jgi:ferredoxin